MRIVLLAPEIVPPLSEGRKRFVLDLANTLHTEGHAVCLLASGDPAAALPVNAPTRIVPGHHRVGRLLGPVRALPAVCDQHGAEVVVNFPYGTFSGRHFLPARAYMMLIDRLCRYRGILCLTVLYSIDRYSTPVELARRVSRLVTGPIMGWRGPTLPLGRDISAWPLVRRERPARRRVLFTAGMLQPTRERFTHVLEVRGLIHLLRVGDRLAPRSIELHVAVPLLADPRCRQWLLEHPDNRWPSGTLTLTGLADVPQVYHAADLFVFPYAEEITQFMPTSVVESMLAGTPVVLSDQRFLAPLIDASVAMPFRCGDSASLTTVVTELLNDPVVWCGLSRRAQEFARDRLDIRTSARRLIELAIAADAA